MGFGICRFGFYFAFVVCMIVLLGCKTYGCMNGHANDGFMISFLSIFSFRKTENQGE